MSTDSEGADDLVCYQCDECGSIRWHTSARFTDHSCLNCAIHCEPGGRVGRLRLVHHEPEPRTLPQPRKGKRMIQV